MLVSVIANCECDACGKTFHVALDPAERVMEGWSLFEVVEDKVRGSWTSAVRNGVWMCATCEAEDRKEEVEETKP